MDKDTQLIYEAYLGENLRRTALTILCALGIGTGCSTLDIKKILPRELPKPGILDPGDEGFRFLKGIFSQNPELKDKLTDDIEAYIAHHGPKAEPPRGWANWVEEWIARNNV